MTSREARLEESRAKVVAPFVLDDGMRFYCPQENRDALAHPRVTEFHRFLLHEYRPQLPPGTRMLLLLPCTKTKPYPASREHRRINAALLAAGWVPRGGHRPPEGLYAILSDGEDPRLLDASPLVRGDLVVHRMVVSEPMALVPYEHVYTWRGSPSPAASYDDPGLFEGRGTSVCPWRADCTARPARRPGKWRWGSEERLAYAEVHNRLAEIIAKVLRRLRADYAGRLAWVSPGLTHKSFLVDAGSREREGIPLARTAHAGRHRLVGVNDLVPGLVEVHPTRAEVSRAVGRRSSSVLVLPGLLRVLVRLLLAKGEAPGVERKETTRA